MPVSKTLIVKANGDEELFQPAKLYESLTRAGAADATARDITETVAAGLSDGTTTQDIYRKAFRLLRKEEKKPIAARYSLKRAVFSLGPSGFPFERFVAEIFKAKGYAVATGRMIRGACALHEVDLVAQKGSETLGAEIKFHNNLSTKTDLKAALYVYARFDDIRKNTAAPADTRIEKGMLITNTKFTESAIAYAECVNLKMISWEYPREGNLYALINETGLHPITALTSLSSGDKKRLLDRHLTLCRSVTEDQAALRKLGFTERKIYDIIEESAALCQPGGAA